MSLLSRCAQFSDHILIDPLLQIYLERSSIYVCSIRESKRINLRRRILRKAKSPENKSRGDKEGPIRDMLTGTNSYISNKV